MIIIVLKYILLLKQLYNIAIMCACMNLNSSSFGVGEERGMQKWFQALHYHTQKLRFRGWEVITFYENKSEPKMGVVAVENTVKYINLMGQRPWCS